MLLLLLWQSPNHGDTLCDRRVTTSLALVEAHPSAAEAALVQLHDLRAQLAQPLDLADAASTVQRADALRQWVRVARLGAEVSFEAGELLVRSQRKAGTLLLEYIEAAGATTYHHAGGPRTQARSSLPKGGLKQLGLTSKQSSNWQAIARLPGEEFELRIDACRKAERPPATEAFLRAAHRFLLPKRSRVTPTLSLLRRALLALREVRRLDTVAEIAAARQVAKLALSWMKTLDEQAAVRARPTAVQRIASCLLCGRTRPQSQPAHCECGGSWLTL